MPTLHGMMLGVLPAVGQAGWLLSQVLGQGDCGSGGRQNWVKFELPSQPMPRLLRLHPGADLRGRARTARSKLRDVSRRVLVEHDWPEQGYLRPLDSADCCNCFIPQMT